jgi:biopolymer transport protein ExbB
MPILGLLGTVTGMIETFKQIVLYGTGDPRAMADGISMALYTTQAGLIMALPIILFHNLLSNQADRITAEIQSNSMRLVNVFAHKNQGK